MEKDVKFSKFLNEGKGRLNLELGFKAAMFYRMNGVELQFTITQNVRNKYSNIQPTQWSGPEGIWIKEGDVLTGKWRRIRSGAGTGLDDPEPQNILLAEDIVAYYDSPGVNITAYQYSNPSRIFVIQNFTGWIRGASRPNWFENLCHPIGWHSVLSIVDVEWTEDKSHIPSWKTFPGNRSGLGWVNINDSLPDF
jgi:hypothetical protein